MSTETEAIANLVDRICEDEDTCAPWCECCAQEAVDTVLTNADTGRWVRLCADFESREDFNDFPADARAETARAMAADASLLPITGDVGNGAPLSAHRGASSDHHNNQSRGIER